MEAALGSVPKDKYVLLVDNRQEQRLVRILDNKKFNWRKTSLPLQQIALHPFFTELEVGNMELRALPWDFGEPEENAEQQVANNNKEIFELEQAQHLQAEDIAKMKKQLAPSEIISSIVENNQQFNKRTEYSKQKYLKKKERKYMFRIHAEPVTLDSLHKYYFAQEHKAIGSIRWEMLGLILLYAAPFRRVLLAQQTKGILLGAVLVRGAESVTVAAAHKKAIKNNPILDQLNVSAKSQQGVKFTSWEELAADKEAKFDNLIMLGNYNFTQIITRVESQLKDGANIALYCQSSSPLEQAARLMRDRKYLNVRLQDSWSREYQVLQNRTHPLMYMDSASGYLLTGFKVAQ